MGKDSDWTSKYLGSDHHTDRYIGTVVRYEDKTGLRHEEPYRVIAERVKNRGRIMNYYQSVDYEPVAPIRRRRYSDMEDDDLYTTAGIFPAARKALSISNKAMDDGDIRTSVSTRKDQQLLSDITAKLADIAQPVVVRAPSRRVAVRQTAPRIVVGRGSTIYPYTSLPDEVVYSRRSMRAASVPPSPVLSAAEIEYVPGFSRRMEMYTRAESEPPEQIRQKVGYYYGRQPASVEYPGDVAVMSYAPSYYSSGRSAYAVPASPASRRVRYSYSETSPDVSPAYTLNNLRVRTSDARNKLDAHRTMLDRYLPDTGIEEDVQSAVLYKYGELVDRAKSLGRKCQTLGKDYERSYAARKEIPSIMPTNAYYGYYCY